MELTINFSRLIAGELLLLIIAGLIVLLIMPPVHALTISPGKYTAELTPGETAGFVVDVSQSIPEESGIEKPSFSGECGTWMSTNDTGGKLPRKVTTKITVPPTAENRSYNCSMELTPAAQNGSYRYAVAVSYSIRIIGGVAPKHTEKPTTEPTTAPTTTTTTSPPTTTRTPKQTYAPLPAILVPAALAMALWRRRP